MPKEIMICPTKMVEVREIDLGDLKGKRKVEN